MPGPNDSVHARLEQLLGQYGAKLQALLRSHGLDRHGIDIADVEQEVRIRLWRAVERDRSGAFHASYIQRTVMSAVIDALRRAEVRAAEPLPEDDEEAVQQLPEGPVGPERRARDRERMQALGRCMDAIPERRRLPIALHLQGFSLQEIAELADIPSVEAARKLVSRGMEELKSRLRASEQGDFDE
jgi:RNA polymerase sigma-70 factor (ECF subfamily)